MEETALDFKNIVERDYLGDIKSHITVAGYQAQNLHRIVAFDSVGHRFSLGFGSLIMEK